MNGTLPHLVLLVHLTSTLFMVGVIWFVQVVHYPLFAGTGRGEFAAYERRHAARTTWVVAPPMLLEATTGLLLIWCRPAGGTAVEVGIGLVLIAVLWLSTALLQVPCHNALARGFNAEIHKRLVATNWLRTATWTVRGCLVLWMVGNNSHPFPG